MITKTFDKAKPALLLATALFMSVFFVYYVFFSTNFPRGFGAVFTTILHYGLYIFLLLLVDFIGRKNDISKNNSFLILLFALFTVAFPETFLYEKTLLAFGLVLLAIRRIVSLRSGKELQKKIFDAALWISIASCFYFWSVLFFIVLYAGILIYCANNYRHWFIPFLGMAAVIGMANIFTLLFQNAYYTPLDWVREAGFDFSVYHHLYLVVPLSLYLVLLLWSVADLGLYWKDKKLKNKQLTVLLLVVLSVSFFVGILVDVKNGSELIFLSFPLAALAGNYFTIAKDRVFKDFVLWILLILPFVVTILRL